MNLLGYSFRSETLAVQALTHRSWVHENQTEDQDNERLEFLGDALVGAFLAAKLFRRFPHQEEGDLSRMRSTLAGRHTMSGILPDSLLEKMRLGPSVDEEALLKSTLRANLLEAVLGAIWLDGGWPSFEKVCEHLWGPLLKTITPTSAKQSDSKSTLQEKCQGQGWPLPQYEILSQGKVFLATVRVSGQLLGEGKGTTKKAAQQEAAAMALTKWKSPRD